MSVTTLLLCGVGGQGTILAADVLSLVASANNLDVKISEIHGMAQRGGAVSTVVVFGEHVHNMVCDIAEADVVVAFESLEALRNSSALKPDGILIVNDTVIKPLPVATGAVPLPADIAGSLASRNAHLVPAHELALKCGNSKAENVVLLGALSRFLPFSEEAWLKALEKRVPTKFLALNLDAFRAGREYQNEGMPLG